MTIHTEHPAGERIFLGLGTNLGDRRQNLQTAAQALARRTLILHFSRIYETAPWGFADQPAFLNQVLEVRTRLEPLALLAWLKELEGELGRRPSFHYGPRLIDIDILLYGDRVLDEAGLLIPHPRLAERAFVLAPLAEIAPDVLHPVLKVTIQQLLEQVDRSGVEVADE